MPVVILIAILVVLTGVVLVAAGRGSGMPATERADYAPLDLGLLTATDVVLHRPPAALWGYSMQATDEALERIAESIRDRDVRIVALEQLVTDLSREPEQVPLGSPHPAARHARRHLAAGEPGAPGVSDETAADETAAGATVTDAAVTDARMPAPETHAPTLPSPAVPSRARSSPALASPALASPAMSPSAVPSAAISGQTVPSPASSPVVPDPGELPPPIASTKPDLEVGHEETDDAGEETNGPVLLSAPILSAPLAGEPPVMPRPSGTSPPELSHD